MRKLDACGGLPLQLSVAAQLGLAPAQTSSSVFIVWTSGALASIALSLRLRQPIPITWTVPGLVYMGSLAGRFSRRSAPRWCWAPLLWRWTSRALSRRCGGNCRRLRCRASPSIPRQSRR